MTRTQKCIFQFFEFVTDASRIILVYKVYVTRVRWDRTHSKTMNIVKKHKIQTKFKMPHWAVIVIGTSQWQPQSPYCIRPWYCSWMLSRVEREILSREVVEMGFCLMVRDNALIHRGHEYCLCIYSWLCDCYVQLVSLSAYPRNSKTFSARTLWRNVSFAFTILGQITYHIVLWRMWKLYLTAL